MNRKTIRSINPSTLETLALIDETPPGHVKAVVQKGREAFPAWRALGLEKRTRILKNVQKTLLSRSREIAHAITMEMGRPLVESLVLEVESVVDLAGFYADRAGYFLHDRTVPLHNLFFKRRGSRLCFEPLGVIGVISPWNWPLLIPAGCILPALLTGNTVVFKPSEHAPGVGEKLRGIVLESGVPEDVFQVIQGAGETGKALVQSGVEKVFFTGSTDVGRKILQEAAGSLAKCVLEMGGSDAAIVCEDADLETASSGIVWGAFSNCGQNCNAVERAYVVEPIADAFIDRVMEKTRHIRVGDGMDTETDMGPIAMKAQLEKTERIVRQAKQKGARILTGGRRMAGKGYFFEPTVILRDPSMQSAEDEEVFGPILFITPVPDDEEAVRLANLSQFGLSASIWTGNKKRGMRLARRMESGTVMVNDAIVSFGMAEAGWTGIKKSGIGWVHGEKGLDEMVNIKYVNWEPQMRMQKFWWFPYRKTMMDAMEKGMHFLYGKLSARLSALPGALRHFSPYLLKNSRRKEKL